MQHDELENEHRLTAIENLAKSNQHRLEEVERRQDNLDQLVATVTVLKNEQGHIQTDVTEIKADVKALTEKPGKRWDNLIDKVISLIAAALIGYALSQIGL